MTIEETVALLLEADLKGDILYHFVQEDSSLKRYYITTESRQFKGMGNSIFAHNGGKECLSIDTRISLTKAIEIVKEYWDRRIEKHENVFHN
jgi:hypothetical protein